MGQLTTNCMEAVVIDRFGGLDTLQRRTLPLPTVGPRQVLIQVESAGVGVWDVLEREGFFASMRRESGAFPCVLGVEGAGTIMALGDEVTGFRAGERVYALMGDRTPNNGFYAEYVSVDVDHVWRVPAGLSTEQAGALPIDAGAALRGLRDVLAVKPGEAVLIFGSSGGMGHLAVQLAKRLGARVLAVASGKDGIAISRRLGADLVVEGHVPGVSEAARALAPDGVDAALATGGGEPMERALGVVHEGGRVAFPNGVQPRPKARQGIEVKSYDSNPDQDLMTDLNQLIARAPFEVHIAQQFSLDEVAEAHRALGAHHVGRIALRPN